MKNNETHNIRKLYLKLLPAQIFVIATSSLASIVNGLLVGNNLPSEAMVAFGFVVPLTALVGAVAQIISGGSGIVVGHHMGSGETDKINKTFTVSVVTCLITGIVLTAVSLTLSNPLAYLFGARGDSVALTASYIRGLSFGFIGQVLLASLLTYLNMCNKSNVSLILTVVMAFVNLVLGLIVLKGFSGGIFLVGVATSLSQLIIAAVAFIYILRSKNLVHLEKNALEKSEFLNILKLGAPGALASILYAVRNVFVNSASFTVGGAVAVNSMAVLNSFIGVFDAFNIGVGTTVLMLASLYVGERDRKSIIGLSGVSVKVGLVIAFTKVIILCLIGKYIAVLFGAEGEVINESWMLMRYYSYSMPINIFTLVVMNTYQALSKAAYCSLNNLINCIIVPIICCYVIGPMIGTKGIYILYTLAEVVSLVMVYIYNAVKKHKLPVCAEDILLDESFHPTESISVSVNRIEDVVEVSKKIEEYLLERKVDSRRAKMTALCAEEMAGNIVDHGFTKDNKSHMIDIFASVDDGDISLRIKDDCIPFDPHSRLKISSPDDPCKNIGIRMVAKIAKEMNYQVNFGMNVLMIRM